MTQLHRFYLLGNMDITRQTLAFNHQSDYWLDVSEFDHKVGGLLSSGDTIIALDDKDARRLQTVLDLYQGNFLEGFYLCDGRGFDE